MNLVRRVARPLLASSFVAGGIDGLRGSSPTAPGAGEEAPLLASRIPGLQDLDAETLVLVNGAVQVGAGALLAWGRVPRLASLALAATVVPATLSAHRFWEVDDPAERQRQKTQLTRDLGLLGGLLLAAVDTEGRPGVAWRTRHASQHAGAAVRRTRREARVAARTAKLAAGAKGAQVLHHAS